MAQKKISQFVVDNLRLQELAAIVEKNKPFYDAFFDKCHISAFGAQTHVRRAFSKHPALVAGRAQSFLLIHADCHGIFQQLI